MISTRWCRQRPSDKSVSRVSAFESGVTGVARSQARDEVEPRSGRDGMRPWCVRRSASRRGRRARRALRPAALVSGRNLIRSAPFLAQRSRRVGARSAARRCSGRFGAPPATPRLKDLQRRATCSTPTTRTACSTSRTRSGTPSKRSARSRSAPLRRRSPPRFPPVGTPPVDTPPRRPRRAQSFTPQFVVLDGSTGQFAAADCTNNGRCARGQARPAAPARRTLLTPRAPQLLLV